MARYVVLSDYRSGSHGPFEKGTTVDLTDPQADWVNRDAPGTLELAPGEQRARGGRRPGSHTPAVGS